MRTILFILLPFLASGQIYVDSYKFAAPAAELLLDAYPGAAAAYSLRLLDKDYTGDCITVRRATDDALDTIGFVNNYLDTASLKTFCSGTSCFVNIWYDQSGNANNATQTTASNQPQIVSSGSVININTKSSLQFDGISDRFDIPTINIAFNSLSIIGIIKSDISTSNGFAFANPDPQRLYLGYIASSTLYFGYNDGATKFNLGAATTNQELIELYAGTNANAYRNTNASTQITSATTSISSNNLSIGSYKQSTALTTYYDGNVQELIIYTSDQSSNRTGIESNINAFYSIY